MGMDPLLSVPDVLQGARNISYYTTVGVFVETIDSMIQLKCTFIVLSFRPS